MTPCGVILPPPRLLHFCTVVEEAARITEFTRLGDRDVLGFQLSRTMERKVHNLHDLESFSLSVGRFLQVRRLAMCLESKTTGGELGQQLSLYLLQAA